jgi:hypothetical protein
VAIGCRVFFSFLHCVNFLSFCCIIFSLSFDVKIWFGWGGVVGV